jgi:SecD/SecF fusion protein
MRALVSIFAALLIIISVYQLSFTWFVNKHESAMEAKAKSYVTRLYPQSAAQKYPGDQQKEARGLYQDTLDQAFNSRKARLLDSTKETKVTPWGTSYQKAKESELLLGLDLQGGMSVTMNVALDGLVSNLANNPRDPQLVQAIARANQKKANSSSTFIDLFAESYKEINPTGKLAPLFSNVNRNKIGYDASDATVLAYLRDQASAAMHQTFQVLSNRINQFGVAQPNINLDESRGIITVELAGARDPERVRNYLTSTANLQFWEVYNTGELQTSLINSDKALQNYLNGVKSVSSTAQTVDSTSTAKTDSTKKKDTATNTANANPLFRVMLPAEPQQDSKGQQQFAPYIGSSLLKDTGLVNSYLSNPLVRDQFPQDLKFLWGKQEFDDDGKAVNFVRTKPVSKAPLSRTPARTSTPSPARSWWR